MKTSTRMRLQKFKSDCNMANDDRAGGIIDKI